MGHPNRAVPPQYPVTKLTEYRPGPAERAGTGARIHLGKRIGPNQGYVDADACVAFGWATNDSSPAYREGRAVPPLYSVALILPALQTAFAECIDEGAIAGPTGSVHGQHDVYFHAPVQPDSTVQWAVGPYAVQQTPAGVLLTQQIAVSDTSGILLVEHYWSSLFIGGTTESLGGPALADHRYPEGARERVIGRERLDVPLDQAFRYAGVSNDHAPHALDDAVARQEGLPSKILQGMCTLALCGSSVFRVAGVDDPNSLRRLAARFAAPAFPKRDLTVEVADLGTTAEGFRSLAFEARSGGSICISHGRAEFEIA
jgi:acyl dehydratase